MNLLRFPLECLEHLPSEEGAPPAERIISGAPRFRTWTFDEQYEGTLFAGVWEATAGKWRIEYDEWEFCSILSGTSIVTPVGGGEVRLGQGDNFVLQPGFRGTWEVIETTRKLFVVRL
ncbi:MAG: cupin domain-containing protein [Micropepsaceae bacterium]